MEKLRIKMVHSVAATLLNVYVNNAKIFSGYAEKVLVAIMYS